MLALAGYIPDNEGVEAIIQTTKDKVNKSLVRFERHEILMETNVNDLAAFIIIPIIDEVMKRLVNAVIDKIEIMKEWYFLIIEARRDLLGTALDQCLLAMKDICDRYHGGVVAYGFVTTGDSWRMLSYDGASFMMSEKIVAEFDTMGRNKERGMNHFSVIVDCLYASLNNRVRGSNDVVAG
ncbi:hypothetical protein BGX38DRAFT_1277047 [Terfezia claveryi]|nr:hypothetical protein BGX38DRAFT_1277047 [Terfezia claveryi]